MRCALVPGTVPAGLVLGLAVCLCACGSTHSAHFSGAVQLGPGGRAEGRITIPDGGDAVVELVRRGAGGVDYVAQTPAGRRLGAGTLGEAVVQMGPSTPSVVIQLTAKPGAEGSVEYSVHGYEGLDLKWDLSRAMAEVPEPVPVPPAPSR